MPATRFEIEKSRFRPLLQTPPQVHSLNGWLRTYPRRKEKRLMARKRTQNYRELRADFDEEEVAGDEEEGDEEEGDEEEGDEEEGDEEAGAEGEAGEAGDEGED